MPTLRPAQDLKGMPVISVTDGKNIAKVVDLMIEPTELQVVALITSKGGLLMRGVKAIPVSEVRVWGQDAILVSRSDVIIEGEELPGSETWLTLFDQVKGFKAVATDGTQVGEINDIYIDSEGRIMGYSLSRVSIEGPLQKSKRIAKNATQSLGPDTLIVDVSKIE